MPTIADSPLVVKYGVLGLQNNPAYWESIRVIVTQDGQMILYQGNDIDSMEKFLSETHNPLATIIVANASASKKEIIGQSAFQVTEKKKQIMWSTTAKYVLRASSDEDLQDWLKIFDSFHETETAL